MKKYRLESAKEEIRVFFSYPLVFGPGPANAHKRPQSLQFKASGDTKKDLKNAVVKAAEIFKKHRFESFSVDMKTTFTINGKKLSPKPKTILQRGAFGTIKKLSGKELGIYDPPVDPRYGLAIPGRNLVSRIYEGTKIYSMDAKLHYPLPEHRAAAREELTARKPKRLPSRSLFKALRPSRLKQAAAVHN